jgi:hypothetical protein
VVGGRVVTTVAKRPPVDVDAAVEAWLPVADYVIANYAATVERFLSSPSPFVALNRFHDLQRAAENAWRMSDTLTCTKPHVAPEVVQTLTIKLLTRTHDWSVEQQAVMGALLSKVLGPSVTRSWLNGDENAEWIAALKTGLACESVVGLSRRELRAARYGVACLLGYAVGPFQMASDDNDRSMVNAAEQLCGNDPVLIMGLADTEHERDLWDVDALQWWMRAIKATGTPVQQERWLALLCWRQPLSVEGLLAGWIPLVHQPEERELFRYAGSDNGDVKLRKSLLSNAVYQYAAGRSGDVRRTIMALRAEATGVDMVNPQRLGALACGPHHGVAWHVLTYHGKLVPVSVLETIAAEAMQPALVEAAKLALVDQLAGDR